MNASPNIYPVIAFDLHPKIKEFLDQLNQAGQIDHDQDNSPHIISLDRPTASVYKCMFVRNGRPEHFILHTRKKADAIKSWNDGDGYMRKEIVVTAEPSRKERERRPVHPFESIMEQILPRRR